MAIVLPQGRFNNKSDKDIREFIAEKARIIAVVGFLYLEIYIRTILKIIVAP